MFFPLQFVKRVSSVDLSGNYTSRKALRVHRDEIYAEDSTVQSALITVA